MFTPNPGAERANHPAAKRARQHAAEISALYVPARRHRDRLIVTCGTLTPAQETAFADILAAHALSGTTELTIQHIVLILGAPFHEQALDMLAEHLATLHTLALEGFKVLEA